MKKILNQKTFNIIVTLALLIIGLLLYFALSQINDQNKMQYVSNKYQFEALTRQAAINASNAQFKNPVISVSENSVYLPNIRIKLPLDDQSLAMVYSSREVGNPDKKMDTTYDVATQDFLNEAAYMTTRLACYPVRFSFEVKANPFNPNEHAGTPVSLADGRTMQIYTAADKSCLKVWTQTKTNPAALAATLQKATSY